VYADIGDEQDIQQSCPPLAPSEKYWSGSSRPSAGQRAGADDEVGAGTDPAEGAALAKSLLDHLMAHNAVSSQPPIMAS